MNRQFQFHSQKFSTTRQATNINNNSNPNLKSNMQNRKQQHGSKILKRRSRPWRRKRLIKSGQRSQLTACQAYLSVSNKSNLHHFRCARRKG